MKKYIIATLIGLVVAVLILEAYIYLVLNSSNLSSLVADSSRLNYSLAWFCSAVLGSIATFIYQKSVIPLPSLILITLQFMVVIIELILYHQPAWFYIWVIVIHAFSYLGAIVIYKHLFKG